MEITFEAAKENWGTAYWDVLLKAAFKDNFHEYWKECMISNKKVEAMMDEQRQKRLDIRDINDLVGSLHAQGLKPVGVGLGGRLYDDLLTSIKANGIVNAQRIDFMYGLPIWVIQAIPDMVAVITE